MTDVHHLIDRVRRRWLTVAWLKAGSRAAGGAALILLAALGIDALLAPADVPLLLLAAAAVGSALGLALAMCLRLARRPGDAQVARFVEERCPTLQDCLASAAELDAHGEQSPVADLVRADAAARAREVNLDAVIEGAAVRRVAWQAGAALLALALAATLAVSPARRAWQTAWLHVVPHRIAIDVSPGDVRIPAGRPLTIRARMTGRSGSSSLRDARTVAAVTFKTTDERQTQEMRAAGDLFELTVPHVTAPFTYRVTAGGAASREFTVTAVHPPRVERIDVEYRYPAFTGLKPRVEEDGGRFLSRRPLRRRRAAQRGSDGILHPPDGRSAARRADRASGR
ncbi:MAG: hypothetical protein LC804_12650 [Acidobacteria bacterium]|nr:hypothetical protein [Acidobacteriota bacterium]